MGSAIVTRTYQGADDKRLTLSSARIARTLYVGTNWTKLNIGYRYAIVNTSTAISDVAFGLCKGTDLGNLYGDGGDPGGRYFWGYHMDGALGSTNNGNSRYNYMLFGYNYLSGTFNQQGTNYAYWTRWHVSTTELFTQILQYDKNNNSSTFYFLQAYEGVYTPTGHSTNAVKSAIESSTPHLMLPQMNWYSYAGYSWPNANFKTNLDTVCLYVGDNGSNMEISEIMACKIE